jgi:hypothetical protein
MSSDRKRGDFSVPVQDGDALAWAHGERWLPEPVLTTVEEAGAFVDRAGLAVLFPAKRVTAPSLWEAVAGPDHIPFATGMGPAEERVWVWKDELPRIGTAWYGKFIHRRASLLSPALLTALYPGAGEPTDHAALDLPDHAHHVCEALLTGPMPTAALREIVGPRPLRPGDVRPAAPAGHLGRRPHARNRLAGHRRRPDLPAVRRRRRPRLWLRHRTVRRPAAPAAPQQTARRAIFGF